MGDSPLSHRRTVRGSRVKMVRAYSLADSPERSIAARSWATASLAKVRLYGLLGEFPRSKLPDVCEVDDSDVS